MVLEKWIVTGPKVIDLALVRSLKVGLIGGKIDVIGHDEPGARVEVHDVSGKELKISIDGDRLEIDHPQLRWDNFIEVFKSWRGNAKVDISILVPRDVALKFGVISASALISGLQTDARVSTVNGDLVIDSVTGDLEVNTVSGEVSVREHRGLVNAHTVSGDITVQGAIRRFSADGVSGEVFVDTTGTPDEIQNNTVSGDLTVRFEESVAARYNVNSVSGTLQLGPSTIKGLRGGGYNGTTGELDGAWTEFRANSVSGNISVVFREGAGADGTADAATGAPTGEEASA
ncbi:DUF4097 family beta strand repeat-containing protein [Herbiconiux moechotypicola]|uniref:DUF4097 family beta strand repeat-containing protein n=1 Tax=Herbiconiux moechotypicola TaxID=637393 RepID=A0ABP5QTT4_9MICO|nr:DUF4097 family beta strand repeat-containing protein [Herbiconiux moechotypicola]MCS5730882.1 DUF4097 family beta strand repeat-containing protein [Herbiconiux moechotypicola]